MEGELKRIAEATVSTKPNFAYTLSEIQDDVARVFSTGYFMKANPLAEDTRDGVKLTVELTPNPKLRGLVVSGGEVLPACIIQDAFRQQYGRTLNFGQFRAALQKLNNWYADRGFFGQVVGVEDGRLMEDGVVEVRLAEATVERLQLRFQDAKTGESREEGTTRPEVILRQLCTTPGQVYNLHQARRDIDAVYSMGLFDDVNLLPQPSEGDGPSDVQKVDLTLNVVERKTGGFSAGGGISGAGHAEGALPGFIGSMAYSQRNLFGLNQKLTASVEIGQVDSLFRLVHTDPWVGGDPFRTSRTCSIQNTRTSGNAVHGKAPDDVRGPPGAGGDPEAGAGDGNVVVARMIGGVEYGRPLATGWSGTLGVNWQRAKCLDDKGAAVTQDCYGSPITFSGESSDTMMLALMRAVYSSGTGESGLVFSMEQAVPLKQDWLNFNRFRLRGEKTVPIGPLQLVVCGKGGVIFGDLPPYEAFPIGGTNSVRGYSEGGVGSGRKYVATTAEIHWPLIGPLEGTVFADYGSDLDSAASVLGDPAGVRGKPGSGYGYGAGVRIDSPVGPLRLEYAFNDKGLRRFHLGIGSHVTFKRGRAEFEMCNSATALCARLACRIH